ncbi:MAG TPA: hypothetical protein VE618_02775 [Myxococcaceae bacterium]|nr:hypothetical protein [Myxococcaceae bacterium]
MKGRRWAPAPIALGLLLITSTARAQTAPTSPQSSGVTLSEQQAKKRHSAFSAGAGGPLLIFTETVTGLVMGGVIGATYGQPDQPPRAVYFGLMSGGLLLGGLASIYQYLVPVGLTTAGMSALGTAVGTMAAAGIYLAANGTYGSTMAWIIALGSQIGAAVPLIATMGMDDISAGDASVMASGALYATVLTMLGWLTANGTVDGKVLLIAPTVGMGAGALLATFTEPHPPRVLTLTAVPLGVGLVLWWLGGIAEDIQLQAASALTGTALAFALTYLFTSGVGASDTPRRAMRVVDRLLPTVLVMPAGERGRQVAVGPGLVGSF